MCQFQQNRQRRTNRIRRIHIGGGSHQNVCVNYVLCVRSVSRRLLLRILFNDCALYVHSNRHCKQWIWVCTKNTCGQWTTNKLILKPRKKNNQNWFEFLFNKCFSDQFQYSNRTECFVAIAETCMTVSFGFVVLLWEIFVAWRRWANERIKSVNLWDIWEFVKFTWI